MFKAWNLSKTWERNNNERSLKARGYWPGAETDRFRLWWNDDDDMIVEEKKENAFKLTYNDDAYLYIVIGYGQQPQGGYSIAVNELYLTEDAIFVNTTLLGPESTSAAGQTPSYPYIVLKTDYLDKPVVFE